MNTSNTSINTLFYQADKVWDTTQLTQHLQGLGLVNNRKAADRWLQAQSCLPTPIDTSSVHDENNNPLKTSVLAQLTNTIKRKRQSILFIQSFTHTEANNNQHYGLFANDAKGSRRWLWSPTPWDELTLTQALLQLTAYNNKDTWFFPHGAITQLCRQLDKGDGTALHAYIQPNHLQTPQAKLGLVAYADDFSMLNQPASPKSERNKSKPSTANPTPPSLSHLDRLEAESLYIMREVVAQADNPAMLYSVGKDSAVMLHLARKAFYPAAPPFPLLHVDTRWKFQSMYQFRDQMAKEANMTLLVHSNPEGLRKGINPIDHGSALHTEVMKTEALKQALDKHQFDITLGGARRDEEKSRAKERVFSLRNAAHRWDPRNQRPELWQLYNGQKKPGDSIRAFPLSNWTELDIWQYIYQENIPIVPLYFARIRPIVERNDSWIMLDDNRLPLLDNEIIQFKSVRFRTLGCYPLTGAIESKAQSVEDIVLELLHTHSSERQGRAIDQDSNASMESKKQEGYF